MFSLDDLRYPIKIATLFLDRIHNSLLFMNINAFDRENGMYIAMGLLTVHHQPLAGIGAILLDRIIFNKTKVPVLNAVLDVTQMRQRVIANNIANVATQGYRKKSLRFQEYLESFVGQPPVAGRRLDPRHLPIPRSIAHPEVYEPESGVNDSGLNNVDVDREMAELAENHLFFNAGQRLIARQFETLRKSITGRSR